MVRLARAFTGANAALLAATVYLVNPYMLFTAFERSAYGELLAAAWIPLLLHSILRERVTIRGVALPVALLWLTNAPAAIMGSYTLALLGMMRHWQLVFRRDRDLPPQLSLQLALRTIAGTALGFGLAAFYIVPAAYERRFVQIAMAMITGMRIDQNSSSSIRVPRPTRWTTTRGAAHRLIDRRDATDRDGHRPRRSLPSPQAAPFLAGPLAILTAGIAFLLTPLSAFVWRHAPEADLLQFPWRLLAILAPICVLAFARALTGKPGASSTAALSRWVGRNSVAATSVVALILVTALTLPAYHAFQQPCDPEDTATARLALFHSGAGTDPTDEYTPTNADNDSLKPGDPPYWLGDSPDAKPPAGALPGGVPSHLTIVAPHAEWAILNLRYYPNWVVRRQGTQGNLSADVRRRADGLIRIQVPAGVSTLDIAYRRSFDETAGDIITLLALGLYLFALRAKSA